jgi:putative transposase
MSLSSNHIHGVITVGAGPRACPEYDVRSHSDGQQFPNGQPQGVASTMSLPDIVHRFKTITTKRYADGVKQNGWKPFPGKLWQRNYYEHIIRNDNEIHRILQIYN